MPLTSPSTWWGSLTNDQKATVIENVAAEASKRFQKYMDVIVNSVGFDELQGEEAVEAFRNRAPEVWARIAAEFPADYEEQMVRWGKLERKLLRNPPQPRRYVAQSPAAQATPAIATPATSTTY